MPFDLHKHNSDEFAQKSVRQKIKRRPGAQAVRFQPHPMRIEATADNMEVVRDEEAFIAFFVRVHHPFGIEKILVRIYGCVLLKNHFFRNAVLDQITFHGVSFGKRFVHPLPTAHNQTAGPLLRALCLMPEKPDRSVQPFLQQRADASIRQQARSQDNDEIFIEGNRNESVKGCGDKKQDQHHTEIDNEVAHQAHEAPDQVMVEHEIIQQEQQIHQQNEGAHRNQQAVPFGPPLFFEQQQPIEDKRKAKKQESKRRNQTKQDAKEHHRVTDPRHLGRFIALQHPHEKEQQRRN